jgi:hypothetical protein
MSLKNDDKPQMVELRLAAIDQHKWLLKGIWIAAISVIGIFFILLTSVFGGIVQNMVSFATIVAILFLGMQVYKRKQYLEKTYGIVDQVAETIKQFKNK